MSSQAIATDHAHGHDHNDIVFPATIPFLLVHVAALGAIWTGVSLTNVAICIGLYFFRMFVVTAGYHRYFSHRSFKTSRVGQFVLGFLCQMSAQRGILWWAAKHREHHRYSDTPKDVHSPVQSGFFYSHVGWIFSPPKNEANYDLVKDLSRYPELRWLDKHKYLPAAVLGFVIWLIGGWPMFFVGFIWSTVLLYHGSFAINSLAHVHGKQRYVTGDESRNNFLLALITLGEGWHNNHHHYQSSTRQGFRWWEIDITYYILKVLSWFRIVWDLREPPEHVVKGEGRLGRRVIERAAERLAHSFPLGAIAEQIRAAWYAHRPALAGGAAATETAAGPAASETPAATTRGQRFRQELAGLLPDLEDLRHRAEDMFAQAPRDAMDEIVRRAHDTMIQWLDGALGELDGFPGLRRTVPGLAGAGT